MADEIKVPTQPKAKSWKYVGPGSTNFPGAMPAISNLPLDPKQPRLGTRGMVRAADVPDDLIEYVMSTNTAAKGWWVYE